MRITRAFARALREYPSALRRLGPNTRLFLISTALSNAALGVAITVFGIYVKSAGLSESVVGDAEAALSVAAAAVCFLAPPLIAVLGYRRLMIAASLFAAIQAFGQAWIPLRGPLLAFALVGGVAHGIMQSAAAPFLSESNAAAERPHAFSADLLARVVSAFAGGILGGVAAAFAIRTLGEVDAYRVTLAFAGILLLLSAVPLLRLSEDLHPMRHAVRAYADTVRAFGAWRRTAKLLASQMAIALGAGMVIPFISLYLKHELGATIDQVGFVQGASQLAIGVAAIGAPLVARRVGLIRGTVLAEALSIPFLIAIPFATSLPLAALLFWFRAALMNLSWPLFGQFSMEGLAAREKPLVAGWLALGWSVAWFFGSAIGGRLMTISYRLPYALMIGCYILGVALTYFLFRAEDVRAETLAPEIVPEAAR